MIRAATAAREVGVRVAVDLACAAMIETYGAQAFRALVRKLDPALVFGNERAWDMVGGSPGQLSVDAVLKRGRAGATFAVGGVCVSLGVTPGPVVDVTGAGDALAAGYFVGGPHRAMAAARCIAQTGAAPPY